jgi:hypothetical protein
MSAGFITQKEADLQRQKRQEEWDKVRTESDPLEPPENEKESLPPIDHRPLHEKLNANKVAEQEAILNQRAFKNQIRGLNEDEAAYLKVLKTAEVNEILAKQKEEENLFSELRRNQSSAGIRQIKSDDRPKPNNSLIETGKMKKQSALLKNAIKRKSVGGDQSEPKSAKIENKNNKNEQNSAQIALAKLKADQILEKKEPTVTGLGLLVGQYSDSDENANSDTSDSDEDSDGLEVRKTDL